MGTTILLHPLDPPVWTRLTRAPEAETPALTRFHLARRFWNQILTCTSLRRRACAICERSLRLRYFFEWNSFSSSSSCSLVKAVRRRRALELAPELAPALAKAPVDSSPLASPPSLRSSS